MTAVIKRGGIGLPDGLLNGQNFHRHLPGPQAEGNPVPLLHLVGGPGGTAVDGHQPVVAGLVGHGTPLDEAGDLEIFVQAHMERLLS